jgi:alkanesulfonate monooxygenase SsuD/methylene tetrahydromethanopterin reductase-like flavin-dependent oxidoreductase (luciferase family)
MTQPFRLPPVEVGIRAPHALFAAGPQAIATFASEVEGSGLDRIWVGDHVSFRGGQGYDGLLQAAVLSALTRTITIQTAVYLLPLRHPVPVARQVASVAEIAPGRFVFGVGVGGDDRREPANCGVDPGDRGRRADESLMLVRRLLAGEVVDHPGPRFPLNEASVRPAPDPAVPVVVGGRAQAALERAGRLSEGWLGVFVNPERFGASVATVMDAAQAAGRGRLAYRHGVLVWCGFGPSRQAARALVAPAVESLYQMPFERFEAYVPYGSPDDVAGALAPYVAAGVGYILLSPLAPDIHQAVHGAATVRRLLTG